MTHPARRPIALITGASSGIGRGIALRLAQDGYDLAICARRQDRLDDLSQSLKPQSDVLAQSVDLRDEAQIFDFFSAIKERWGRLDVLVNNAGLGQNEPLLSGSTAGWREMLDVNVLALCICTREAVQLMQANAASGHIVHISSMSGHRVPSLSGLYSATKFAVRSLTEGLRRELRAANSDIRVSSISPGYVETEFAEKYHQSLEKAQETYGRFPVLQPQDIANAVAYVLSQPAYVQVHDILVRPTGQET